MRLRAWIRNFFGFSRTETNAFLILLPLMVILIFSEPIYRYWFVRQPQDFSRETKTLDSLIATWNWDEPDSTLLEDEEPIPKLFSFNPNQVAQEELHQLGFSSLITGRIIHYRAKGGKFLVKKDLLKIYGMDSALYQRIYPFIKLPETMVMEKRSQKSILKEKQEVQKFDLNKADTFQLKKIFGIGDKLSQRIVSYREKLGGFVSMNQLNEVYGLDSVLVHRLIKKFFLEENFQPKLININTATDQELGSHPYIKYKLAKAITTYRFQHGAFQSLDELKKIALMDELKFQRIKPYLSVKP